VQRKSWTKGLGRTPYVRVTSWKDVPAIMRYYSQRPAELDQLQEAVIDWWDAYQRDLSFRVNQLMDINFGDFLLAYYE